MVEINDFSCGFQILGNPEVITIADLGKRKRGSPPIALERRLPIKRPVDASALAILEVTCTAKC
jgi:hypothetical protein